jgi:hypothetical protein
VTYEQYLAEVIKTQARFSSWRLGQTLFNVLAEQRPGLAESIRGTNLDPFYADHLVKGYEKIYAFLEHVEREWQASTVPTA